jgi:hypothetical protein
MRRRFNRRVDDVLCQGECFFSQQMIATAYPAQRESVRSDKDRFRLSVRSYAGPWFDSRLRQKFQGTNVVLLAALVPVIWRMVASHPGTVSGIIVLAWHQIRPLRVAAAPGFLSR